MDWAARLDKLLDNLPLPAVLVITLLQLSGILYSFLELKARRYFIFMDFYVPQIAIWMTITIGGVGLMLLILYFHCEKLKINKRISHICVGVFFMVTWIPIMAVGILLLVESESIPLGPRMRECQNQYYCTDSEMGSRCRIAWDNAQTQFQCCGIITASEWNNTKFGSIPSSCCAFQNSTAAKCTRCQDLAHIHLSGCEFHISNALSTYMMNLAGLLLPLGCVQAAVALYIFFIHCHQESANSNERQNLLSPEGGSVNNYHT